MSEYFDLVVVFPRIKWRIVENILNDEKSHNEIDDESLGNRISYLFLVSKKKTQEKKTGERFSRLFVINCYTVIQLPHSLLISWLLIRFS